MAIVEITGKIIHDDGMVSEFRIAAEPPYPAGYHQWGAPTEVLGRNVDVLTHLVAAVQQERRGDIPDEVIQTDSDEGGLHTINATHDTLNQIEDALEMAAGGSDTSQEYDELVAVLEVVRDWRKRDPNRPLSPEEEDERLIRKHDGP